MQNSQIVSKVVINFFHFHQDAYNFLPIFLFIFVIWYCPSFKFFWRFYLFIFRDMKGGRKTGRETSTCGCLSRAPCWGLTHNPGTCPDPEWKQQLFCLQAGTQSTEPHQTRPSFYFLLFLKFYFQLQLIFNIILS